jgi:hypothetical protein
MFVPPNWLAPSKNKKHPWGHVGATQLALLTYFILMCFFRDKLQGWVVPMYGICF